MSAQHAKPTAKSSADTSSSHPAPQAAAYAEGLTKKYGVGNAVVTVLGRVSISFAAGEFTAIMGSSGSGKSALVHCIAGLDSATPGSAHIGTTELSELPDKEIAALRRDRLSSMFQPFNLMPMLMAAENVTPPINIADWKVDKRWLEEITIRLEPKERFTRRPSELSGGQRQRVACTRAIVNRPETIFGDEPMGNLDSDSSREVLTIPRNAVNDIGQTVVIVAHDATVASYADRVVFLADGRVVGELRNPTPADILARMADIEDP